VEKINAVYYPKFRRLVVHRVDEGSALIEVYSNVRCVKAVNDSSCGRKWRVFLNSSGSTLEIDVDGVEVMW